MDRPVPEEKTSRNARQTRLDKLDDVVTYAETTHLTDSDETKALLMDALCGRRDPWVAQTTATWVESALNV